MRARVRWIGGRSFEGQGASGPAVSFGRGHDGGAEPGPSPMELILIGTGGCSAFDVVMILEKGREAVEDVQVELDAERAETDPKVFTRIHMHFIVKGRGLSEKKVARAVALSVEKYCSASAMLGKTAEMSHDFEVVETGA